MLLIKSVTEQIKITTPITKRNHMININNEGITTLVL